MGILAGFWVVVLFFPSFAHALSAEGQALLEFKSNITDANQLLINWDASDATPCNWTGVNCTSNSVTTLDLWNFNISGPMPPGIFGQLTNLTHLNIGGTSLNGTIPTDLLNCSKLVFLNMSTTWMAGLLPLDLGEKLPLLQYLDFSYASFVGPIPDSVGDLLQLETLKLTNTNFSGFLPSSIGNLQNLRELFMGFNNFTSVPFPSVLANLVNLETLQLESVNFTEGPIPEWIGNLTKLQTLQLDDCNLVGTIPESLANLTALNWLWLNANNLSGRIPDIFGGMTNLTGLDLSQNSLTDEIPPGICQLLAVENMDLWQNFLSGGIPEGIGNLTKLIRFDVSQNNMSGTIPPSLGTLQQIKELRLWQNNFTGGIPPQIGDWQYLTDFKIFQNSFTGNLPYNLGSSTSLTIVDVSTNLLDGLVPPNLCNGNQLTELILFQNNFSGPLPDTYGNCSALVKVEVYENSLSGPVPIGLWGSPLMQFLTLYDNKFNGTIGTGIGMATNLGSLLLNENGFTGSIPSEIGQIGSALHKLDMSGNDLSGPIPLEIGNLSSLQDLYLDANALIGSIPPTIGNLTRLVQLNLSCNGLTGMIPASLGALTDLGILDLSYNKLSGDVPAALSALQQLETFNVSYNQLSGEIPQDLVPFANIEGNPNLCAGSVCGGGNSTTSGMSKTAKISWVVGVTFAVAAILLVLGSCYICRKYHILLFKAGHQGPPDSWHLTSFHKTFIDESEITNLDEDNVIGSGGSGKVYKVVLPNGDCVAVKKLWTAKKDELLLHDYGFKSEVETLGSIRHRNIVKLLCCCSNKDTNLLVYEYMPNGSLDNILHSTKAGTLDWGTRFRIAFGAAQGLAYLHHDCSPQILHRDVKSSNILLDLDYEAHVADFGIAKTLSTAYSNYMSNVAGSRGYIAPEYGYTLKVGEKSDIYSFGVVLMELVTGKRPLEPKLYGENNDIVNWVYEKVESKQELYQVLDPNCSKDDHNDMLLVLRIALLCTNMLPSNRPSMREVVMMLLEATPKPKKNFVELEESAEEEEEEEEKAEKKGHGGKQDDDTLQVLIMQ